MIEYTFAMKESLEEVNKHSFNNFKLRAGKLTDNLFDVIVSKIGFNTKNSKLNQH